MSFARISAAFAVIFLLSGQFADTALAGEGCYRGHLSDAMDLNVSRLETYSAWSGGASVRVSEKLLWLEKEMKIASYLGFDFDGAAAVWEPLGVRLTCEAFVSMEGTPAQARTFEGGAPRSLKKPSSFQVSRRLKPFAEKEDVAGFVAESKKILAELDKEKRGNCLTRHFVESMARIASLIPSQVARVKAAGELSTPAPLAWRLLRSHFLAMPQVTEIDELAAPLHLRGLPILCNDVPSIPLAGE